ncbi:hypothetical protein [Nonomuraea roseola]|uniref:Uncharacterized protein n=1 Tax=Nonomuraea roseola TaxID=46179 RepID=A0ABV5Q228_9ACTN
MPLHQPSRRAVLTAAIALPASVVGASLLTAPAVAAAGPDGTGVVHGWQPLALRPGVMAFDGDVSQARVVKIAGTDFLQLRGAIRCDFAGDAPLGSLPAGLVVREPTRGVCPRNNHNGLNVCRVEADAQGRVVVLGATPTDKITWVRLDGFSSVLS